MNQPEAKLPDSWTFFDKIYCITLDERVDRRRQAEGQFAALGFVERVEFVTVAKHPTDREEGIFQSHMECLRRGLAAGGRHILVFEDDVFFQRYHEGALRRACEYLSSSADWNGFFLGCMIDGSTRIPQKNLAKIRYRTLAHAYALRRPFAEKLVAKPWQGVPFDEFLRRHNEDYYALYPMCAFQGRSGTDNQRVAIDRVRRLFGGLPFIQKVNELYHNHPFPLLGATMGVTACVVLALALLFLGGTA